MEDLLDHISQEIYSNSYVVVDNFVDEAFRKALLKEQTDLFMRHWETNLHVNEKFLFFVLGAWIGEGLPIATPMLETHGRSHEGIPALAESLGWFTQFYPIDIKEHNYILNNLNTYKYLK